MIPNPAYVTHPTIAASKRIRVEGFHDSDCEIVVALVQLKNGQVGMAVDNIDASFESLIKVHALLENVVKEVDRRLQLHAQTVPGER